VATYPWEALTVAPPLRLTAKKGLYVGQVEKFRAWSTSDRTFRLPDNLFIAAREARLKNRMVLFLLGRYGKKGVG
jgi:hypothetical protein